MTGRGAVSEAPARRIEFIVRYVTENGRWASPKYVLGESYGGMRTGGVSYYLLNRHNMALNGVILVSPFMEMTTGFAGLGIDLPHVMFLPTFAATAWYHDALTDKPGDLEAGRVVQRRDRDAVDHRSGKLRRTGGDGPHLGRVLQERLQKFDVFVHQGSASEYYAAGAVASVALSVELSELTTGIL